MRCVKSSQVNLRWTVTACAACGQSGYIFKVTAGRMRPAGAGMSESPSPCDTDTDTDRYAAPVIAARRRADGAAKDLLIRLRRRGCANCVSFVRHCVRLCQVVFTGLRFSPKRCSTWCCTAFAQFGGFQSMQIEQNLENAGFCIRVQWKKT